MPSSAVAQTEQESYDGVSRSLHWLTLLFLLVMFTTAWGRNLVPFQWRDFANALHISCGVGVLVVTLARLLWRPFRCVPLGVHQDPFWMRLAAEGVHFAIYALLIAMPLCGWAMLSAFGKAPSIAGLIDLPPILMKDRALAVLLKEIHATMGLVFAGLIGLHAAAAIFHHAVVKDDTLVRMLPLKAIKRSVAVSKTQDA